MLFIKDIKSFEIDGDKWKSQFPRPIVTNEFIAGKSIKTASNISKSTRALHSKDVKSRPFTQGKTWEENRQ